MYRPTNKKWLGTTMSSTSLLLDDLMLHFILIYGCENPCLKINIRQVLTQEMGNVISKIILQQFFAW